MDNGRASRRVVAAVAVATLLSLIVGVGAASPSESADPQDDPAVGAVHDGLFETRGCAGGYGVESPVADGHTHQHATMCSHGPDEAPAGIDVRDQPSVAELRERAGDNAAAGDAAVAAEGGTVPCYDDGASGKRLQAVYAVSSDRPDRFDAVAPLIAGYAATADQAFAASAERDGGVRHLRWVTDGECTLSVQHVVLSPTGDDTLPNTRAELVTQGLNRPDRKYVVWADAAVYCGIAYVVGDSRPDASNPANAGPTFARVDTSCWGFSGSVEAHEIAHMLGAVQLGAPHSNGQWHCTDEYDRLCYNDGSGATLSYLCASSAEPLLDCNGDDYFNVAPAVGTWLATHWNLASSQYLETVEPTQATPAPVTTPPATPAPSVLPPVVPPAVPTAVPPAADPVPDPRVTRRVVTSWTARLPGRGPSRTFRVRAVEGPLSATVRFAGPGRVRISVRDDAGRSMASRLRRSGRTLVTPVLPGRYVVTLRGEPGARVALKVARLVR